MGAVESAVGQATAELAKVYGPAIALLVGVLIIAIAALTKVTVTLYKKMWQIKEAADAEISRLQGLHVEEMRRSQARETDLVERLENIAEGMTLGRKGAR